jgi:dihydrofolate synthase/folylpolyglutamate synthase
MPASAAIQRDLDQREAAARFLLERIDYERSRAMPYDPHRLGLDRMRVLLGRLGRPDQGLPVVHVAGTKGKGSTSAMIAAALSAAGLRTGLFTSPHLDGVEERMRIDGQPCSPDDLVELIDLVRPAVETMDGGREEELQNAKCKMQNANSGETAQSPRPKTQDPRPLIPNPQSLIPSSPTYFEITTAMALLHFARQKARAAVLEVGLGGRLDATNVCAPQLSVITSISFDHTQQLGNTLAAIAREKAGIIKPGVPVVSGVTAAEPREVIRQICRERGCRLIERQTDFDFDYEPPRRLELADACGVLHYRAPDGCRAFSLRLAGRHQAANAALAVAALDQLRRSGWQVPDAAIGTALAGLTWPARIEVVARRPAIVLDGAHNVASVEALLETLDACFAPARRILIFAASRDKDHHGMLRRLLGRFDEILLTQYLDNPRAMPAEELERLAAQIDGRRRPVYAGPAAAWEAARRLAAPEDLLCVSGSFFIAAEIRRLLV